ncbi:hypothetical protein PCURB6_43810 [Paenibacillus curdlanolyticus]|nr:hypothetical protein PCURB6_43810 [Paenibacillus curdlanolyticus]
MKGLADMPARAIINAHTSPNAKDNSEIGIVYKTVPFSRGINDIEIISKMRSKRSGVMIVTSS